MIEIMIAVVLFVSIVCAAVIGFLVKCWVERAEAKKAQLPENVIEFVAERSGHLVKYQVNLTTGEFRTNCWCGAHKSVCDCAA